MPTFAAAAPPAAGAPLRPAGIEAGSSEDSGPDELSDYLILPSRTESRWARQAYAGSRLIQGRAVSAVLAIVLCVTIAALLTANVSGDWGVFNNAPGRGAFGGRAPGTRLHSPIFVEVASTSGGRVSGGDEASELAEIDKELYAEGRPQDMSMGQQAAYQESQAGTRLYGVAGGVIPGVDTRAYQQPVVPDQAAAQAAPAAEPQQPPPPPPPPQQPQPQPQPPPPQQPAPQQPPPQPQQQPAMMSGGGQQQEASSGGGDGGVLGGLPVLGGGLGALGSGLAVPLPSLPNGLPNLFGGGQQGAAPAPTVGVEVPKDIGVPAAAIGSAVEGIGKAAAAGCSDTVSKAQEVTSDLAQKVGDAASMVRAGFPLLLFLTTSTTSTPAMCHFTEGGTNYPGNDLRAVPNTPEAGWCCYACQQDPDCVAWSFHGQSMNCWLKGSLPRKTLTRVPDPDFISGLVNAETGHQIHLEAPRPGASLYCFALIVPDSYEVEMTRMQYQESTGIFDCDEYATYSNQEVLPGILFTKVIQSNLQCEKGGEFNTALNTPIFFVVWDGVVKDGRYLKHDWTVKCDPDSVFFPGRLRDLVQYHPEVGQGVYLNNCGRGMHGPIEVFSRNAVTRWAQGRPQCISHFTGLCNGDCQWGEDMFIDQCLEKVLGVSRQYEEKLLVEEHCDPKPGWQDCYRKDIVAFHPFKTVDGYKTCMGHARAAV